MLNNFTIKLIRLKSIQVIANSEKVENEEYSGRTGRDRCEDEDMLCILYIARVHVCVCIKEWMKQKCGRVGKYRRISSV